MKGPKRAPNALYRAPNKSSNSPKCLFSSLLRGLCFLFGSPEGVENFTQGTQKTRIKPSKLRFIVQGDGIVNSLCSVKFLLDPYFAIGAQVCPKRCRYRGQRFENNFW